MYECMCVYGSVIINLSEKIEGELHRNHKEPLGSQKGKVPSCEHILFYVEPMRSGQALVAVLVKYHLDLKSLP